MRWLPILWMVGCGGERVTSPSQTDTDVDTDTDTDADTDVAPPTVLINFSPNCSDVTAIGPGLGESNHLAATLLGPGVWPYRVDRVKIALSNESQDVLSCDAGLPHSVRVWVLDGGVTRPPDDRAPDVRFEFDAITVEDPVRLLQGDFEPPIVLDDGQNLAVAVQFAGLYPESSCLTACNQGFLSGVDYWSNAADQPYSWSLLSDFGIDSNLWIFAEGEAVD